MKTQTEPNKYTEYLKNYLLYPDYVIYKRLAEMPQEDKLVLDDLEEVYLIINFSKFNHNFKIKPGSFYKVIKKLIGFSNIISAED